MNVLRHACAPSRHRSAKSATAAGPLARAVHVGPAASTAAAARRAAARPIPASASLATQPRVLGAPAPPFRQSECLRGSRMVAWLARSIDGTAGGRPHWPVRLRLTIANRIARGRIRSGRQTDGVRDPRNCLRPMRACAARGFRGRGRRSRVANEMRRSALVIHSRGPMHRVWRRIEGDAPTGRARARRRTIGGCGPTWNGRRDGAAGRGGAARSWRCQRRRSSRADARLSSRCARGGGMSRRGGGLLHALGFGERLRPVGAGRRLGSHGARSRRLYEASIRPLERQRGLGVGDGMRDKPKQTNALSPDWRTAMGRVCSDAWLPCGPQRVGRWSEIAFE